jgi:biotin synthase
MDRWIMEQATAAMAGRAIGRVAAERWLDLAPGVFPAVLHAASLVRTQFRGNRVKTCSIVNAKSGACSEDCKYCAQSAHHATATAVYPLMETEAILQRVGQEEGHSQRFGIVTSGRGLNAEDLGGVCRAVEGFAAKGLDQKPCASLGILDEAAFLKLKAAGLTRYHHNLETSRNFYPSICTTHTYDDRVRTIRAAQKAGLELCVGGIFGMGETRADRIDFLHEVDALDPVSVPINFLVGVPGTQLADQAPLALWEAVKIISLARLIMPRRDILLGAGRIEIFKDAQHLVFLAGANSMIIGDLLTVKNRTVEEDLRVLADLGLELDFNEAGKR